MDHDRGQPCGGDEVRGPGGQGPGSEQQVHPGPDGGHRDGLLGGCPQPAGPGAGGRRNQGHERELSGLSVCLKQTNLNLCVVIYTHVCIHEYSNIYMLYMYIFV